MCCIWKYIIICMILIFSNIDYIQADKYIVEIKPGKLESTLRNSKDITELIIKGSINGSDIKFLQTCKELIILDISEANIVSGGKIYLERMKDNKVVKYSVKKKNVLPSYMFCNLPNLSKVILPKSITAIEENSLLIENDEAELQFTGLIVPEILKKDCHRVKKIIVPSSVYKEYKDSFGYYSYIFEKDDSPSDFILTLSDKDRLNDLLDGVFSHVKSLTLSGIIRDEDKLVISKLKNLEVLNLQEANLRDYDFLRYINNLDSFDSFLNQDINSDYCELLDSIFCEYHYFLNYKKYIDSLIMDKACLDREIQNLRLRIKNNEENKTMLGVISSLVEESNDDIERMYKKDSISFSDYAVNKLQNDNIKKGVKNAKISNSNQLEKLIIDLTDWTHDIDKEVSYCKKNMDMITKNGEDKFEKFKDVINTNSIVSSLSFMQLPNLKKVIFPRNTIAIMKNAFVDCPMMTLYDNDKLYLLNDSLRNLFSVNLDLIEYSDNGEMNNSFGIQNPKFPGGYKSLDKFISDNLVYPVLAKENEIQGAVEISFMVGVDGSLYDIKIEQSAAPILEKEAIRLINLMPFWIPGEKRGKPFPMRTSINVNFYVN